MNLSPPCFGIDVPARGRWHGCFKICAIQNRDGHAKRERACWHSGNRGWQMGWQSLRRRSRTSGVSTSDRPVGGPSGASTDASSPRAPADEEAPPRFWATVVSGRGGKARPFRHVCHVRDGGPPGSWSDYNHCEVSVTVANPRAVFGRDAIDMMGSIQSIATSAPGRSPWRKWFNPGISLAPSRDAAATTEAVRLGPATCLNRGDTQRQSPRASDLDTRYPTNPKIGGTR